MATDLESFIDEAAAKYDAAEAGTTKEAATEVVAEEEKPNEAAEETEQQAETTEETGEEAATEEATEETEAEEEKPSAEFEAAAGKHIPMALDDLPEAARPMVAKRLKEMESGFTRMAQEQRAYRKEQAEFNAEKQFLKEKPVDWIVDQFQKNPTLLSQVEEELQKMQEPRYAEARRINREADQKLAQIKAREDAEAGDRFNAEVQRLDAFTVDIAKQEGVPYDYVEDAIAFMAKALKADENRLPREEELKHLIATKAQSYRRMVGAVKGGKTKDYAKLKAEQVKTAGLKGKPGSQPAPRPPAKPSKPKSNDPDDVNDFLVSRLFPDGESAA